MSLPRIRGAFTKDFSEDFPYDAGMIVTTSPSGSWNNWYAESQKLFMMPLLFRGHEPEDVSWWLTRNLGGNFFSFHETTSRGHFSCVKKISWISIWSFFISTHFNTRSVPHGILICHCRYHRVCHRNCLLSRHDAQIYYPLITEVVFSQVGVVPYQGLCIGVNHLAWCNRNHQATRRYHFASGIPAKESPTFHWHSKHSQPIDTMARWGRTSAEYNSLFCIPFSKLLIPGLDINKISKFLSYFDLASWTSSKRW